MFITHLRQSIIKASNLDEIIKGCSAPDTSGPPHPFPVGNLQTVMFSCTVGVATDSDKLPRFIGAKIRQQIHPFRFSYDFRCNIWHCDHLLPRSDFSFWTRTLLFAVASRLSRRFSMWSVSLLSKSESASRKGLGDWYIAFACFGDKSISCRAYRSWEATKEQTADLYHRILTSAGYSASSLEKYHYLSDCHRHVRSNLTLIPGVLAVLHPQKLWRTR